MLVLERNGELYNKRSNSFMNVREREYNSFSSIEEIKKLPGRRKKGVLSDIKTP